MKKLRNIETELKKALVIKKKCTLGIPELSKETVCYS